MELTLTPRRFLKDPYRRKLYLSFFCLAMSFIFLFHPRGESDTVVLLKSVQEIFDCVGAGRYSSCSPGIPFSLYQYLPSIPLAGLGLSNRVILHILAYLNFLSLFGCVVLIRKVLRRRSHAMGTLGILTLVTSPLLWYAHSSFGEASAAFFILSFIASILLKAQPWVVISCLILAGVTKDIAFVFLLILGGFCALQLKRKDLLWPLIAGAVLTCSINAAFNYLRYGSPLNQVYLNPLFFVGTKSDQISSFFGLWFSPNGGLFIFWPSFCAIWITTAVLALKHRTNWHTWGIVSGILFMLTLGFSKWFAPFGWIAWGPRLFIPWIPAITMVCLYFYSDPLEALLKSGLKCRPVFITGAAILAVWSIPQYAILFGPEVFDRIFLPTPSCPVSPVIQQDAAYYYHCLRSVIWPHHFPILELYFSSPLQTLAYLLALSIGVTRMKEQLMRRPSEA
jgi:hypothetical protein